MNAKKAKKLRRLCEVAGNPEKSRKHYRTAKRADERYRLLLQSPMSQSTTPPVPGDSTPCKFMGFKHPIVPRTPILVRPVRQVHEQLAERGYKLDRLPREMRRYLATVHTMPKRLIDVGCAAMIGRLR